MKKIYYYKKIGLLDNLIALAGLAAASSMSVDGGNALKIIIEFLAMLYFCLTFALAPVQNVKQKGGKS